MVARDITEDLPLDLTGLGDAVANVSYAPPGMRWDCTIGGLPFLFGMSDQYPMIRETAEFRRQRIDNEREPGEQSLDSGYWVRSQSSFHYGEGLTSAEPLEINDAEARFRYASGGGVDPWTPGQVTLLNETASVLSSSGSAQLMLGVGTGVLHADGSVLKYVTNAGSSSTVTWGGTTGDILSLTSNGTSWFLSDDDGYYKGTLPNGTGAKFYETVVGTNDRTLVRWLKNRLFAVDNHKIYEVTNLTGGSSTKISTNPLVFTHLNTDWVWSDMADGPTAVYASGYAGDVSQIYKFTAGAEGTTSTSLSGGSVVAEMPRGESVLSMYSYLGAYLAIGTSKGLRIAAISSDGSLSLGPLVHETSDGVYDMVAVGNFMWFTVGSKGNAGDRTERPGLYRLDFGTNVNDDPLSFAVAADIVAPPATSGQTKQVTVSGDKLWFTVSGVGVFKQQATYVDEGWLETGRIRLATLEAKAWRDLRLIGAPSMDGLVEGYASISTSSAPSTWTPIVSINGDQFDLQGRLVNVVSSPEPDLYVAFKLSTDDDTKTPVFNGYQLRAIPAPKRSRLVQVPLMCFDYEVDRTGVRYGQKNGAYARLNRLEALENSAAAVTYYDYSTGEQAEAYIERIAYNRVNPPTKLSAGNGGIVRVTLRLL